MGRYLREMESNVGMTLIGAETPVSLMKSDISRDRVPVYDYKRSKVLELSKREVCILQTWERSHNYAECVRVLKEELNTEVSPMTVRRWMGRTHIQERMREDLIVKAKANDLTKEKWLAEGRDMQRNDGKVPFHQIVAWKEMGKALGYYEANALINNNIQINFTERA